MQGSSTTIVMDPDLWRISAGILLAVYSVWSYRRSIPPLSLSRRSVLASLRTAGFALLVVFALDPSIVTRSEKARLPLVPILIDISRSMSIADGSTSARIETSTRIAAEIAGAMDGFRIETIPFAGELYGNVLSADSIRMAEGEGTDIYGALEDASRRYAGDNLAAMILISDGRITRGISRTYDGLSVPVYVVAVGDTLEGADLSVERVEYERSVYAGTRERIRAVIRYFSSSREIANVELIGGGKVLDGFRSDPLEGDGLFEADLEYVPSGEGASNLEVRVGVLEGEVSDGNNRELFKVNVLKDRIDILYIDRNPDWNMTFLRRLCEDSKRLRLEAAVRDPGGGYNLLGGGSWDFPAAAAGLSGHDLVIIGDVGSSLDDRWARTLEDYIETGGALLFLASENSPLVLPGSLSALRKVLPVVAVGSTRIVTGEFHMVVGETAVVSWLRDIPVVAGGRLVLPPLAGAIDGLAATAGASIHLNMTGDGPDRPLLAVEQKERGVSAVILGFPLWRWRLAGEEGNASYNKLFGGLIQYLAEGRNAPAIDVQLDRTVYRTGEKPRVTVFPSTSGSAVEMRGDVYAVDRPASPVETFIPEQDRERPGVYRAVLGNLSSGEYEVRVRVAANEGMAGSATLTVEPLSVEMLRTSSDIDLLERIASSSGGLLLSSAEVSSLPGQIDPESDTVVSTTVRNIRGKVWLLALIVCVFASEWILRRYWGLV